MNKEKKDIVEVISQYVKLELRKNNYIGTCPFCNNNSLLVSKDKNIYKCFNCGSCGNVETFIKKSKELLSSINKKN